MRDLGEIAREGIRRDDRKHAVVCQADAEADQDKSCDKVQGMKNQSVRQHLNPCVVEIDHLAEAQSDDERKKVTGTERFL